ACGPPTGYFRLAKLAIRLPEAGPWEGAMDASLSDWGVRLAPKLDRHVLCLDLTMYLQGEQVTGLLGTHYAAKLVRGFHRLVIGLRDHIAADEIALAVHDDLRRPSVQARLRGRAARPHRLDEHAL